MADTIYDHVDSERGVLVYYLNRMREAVIAVSEGLTDEQSATPGVPSGTSPSGLIKHLTGVERYWFGQVFLGEDQDTEIDMSMDVPPDASREELVAAYRAAYARSNEIVNACPDLSTRAMVANPGEPEKVSLR